MDNDIRTRIWESWSKQKQIKALTQAEKEICSPPDNFEKYEWNVCTRYFKDNEIARVALLEGGDCEDIKLTALGKTLLAGLKEDMHKEPQPEQAAPEPQQEKLHYYCQKAIEKKYLIKVGDGYRLGTWKKAQLAYFLKHFPNADGTFPDKYYSKMFGENRLSKAADQLSMNKLGDGKPRGYGEVDELLQE